MPKYKAIIDWQRTAAEMRRQRDEWKQIADWWRDEAEALRAELRECEEDLRSPAFLVV